MSNISAGKKESTINLGKKLPLCLSCARVPAALCNEDGAYCIDCMKFHLLEKMFVQVNKRPPSACWIANQGLDTESFSISRRTAKKGR